MVYGGSLELDSPAPEDEVNIIAALKQSDRVSSISLTVTNSLLHKLYTINLKLSFLELEDLILLSRDSIPPALPNTFRWGTRLRRLHLTKIVFPALLQLLDSSKNLEDIRLHEAFNPWYFSIEKLMDALSGMAQLRSLSLHFPPHANCVPPFPPDRRVVLPALTRFICQGCWETLNCFLLRIDAPRLGDIQVTLFDTFISDLDLSKLGDFIDRIEMHRLHRHARILSSKRAISICLAQPGAPACFELRLFRELLSEQLSAMSRIFLHFSPFLLNVEDLRISTPRPSSQKDSLCSGQWLELIDSLTGVKWLHLDGNYSIDIVSVLQDAYSQRKTVLPALYKLYLPQPGPRHAPLSEDVVLLMTSRWNSGHPIGVEYEHLVGVSELPETGTPLHSTSTTTY